MNPLVSLAIDGVRAAITLAKNLIATLSKNEAELEAHNAALEKELQAMRVDVADAAAKTREKLKSIGG